MHTIQSVAEKTGLTPDVIRIWERRYSVVSPERTPSNQRLYTDDDIERLNLLRRVTEQGRRISAIAALSTDELREIAGSSGFQRPLARPLSEADLDVEKCRNDAVSAIIELDPLKLEWPLSSSRPGEPCHCPKQAPGLLKHSGGHDIVLLVLEVSLQIPSGHWSW